MSDTDREAFDKWAQETGYDPHQHLQFVYDNAWKAWLAARDHYAPKLPEKDTEQLIKREVFKLDNIIKPNSAYGSGVVSKYAIAALKAAGVRFRDEP